MPFDKKVLFVAPTTDLFYATEEANEVVNTLGANLLQGDVRHEDLLRRVRSYQPDVIIISSHGNDDGVMLSDGIIGPELLKPILSMSDVELVYLNTCKSRLTAVRIHAEIPINFVCTISDTPDRTAFVTMVAFAHHLNSGYSYAQAWFRSKAAGNVNFFFIPKVDMIDVRDNKGNPNSVMDNRPKLNGNGELEDVHEEVVRLSYLMYGNPKWNLQGLIPKIEQMQKEISDIRILVYLILVLLSMSFVVFLVWLLV